MKSKIYNCIQNSVDNYNRLLLDDDLQNNIEIIVKKSIEAFQLDKKMLLCGNGGSAADAQHIAAELSGRFYTDRPPLYAEALHVNSSYMTAVANDYGYERVFSRQIEALAKPGDIAIGISTGGSSTNVISALKLAKELGCKAIGLSGKDGGKFNALCDVNLIAISEDTPRIQEMHILIGHTICHLIDQAFNKA